MSLPNDPAVEDAAKELARTAAEQAEAGSGFSWDEIQLTVFILVFGMTAIGLFYYLVKSRQATPFLMRIYVIIILVFGSLLVVSSGYGTDQIAPIIGFFGTLAGYLLGRSEYSSDPPPGAGNKS